MKKKLFSLLLALCLVFTGCFLASCDKENADDDDNDVSSEVNETVALFSKAYKNTEALDSLETTLDMNISMTMNGQTFDIPMIVDMKIKDASSANPTMFADYSISMPGQSMVMQVYMADGWIYMLQAGTGYKVNAEVAGDDYDFSQDREDIMKSIPDKFFKDVEPVQNADGSQTITLDLSGEDFADLYKEVVDSVKETSAVDDSYDISLKDAKIVVTVKDDYISVYKLSFKMDMTIDSQAVSTDVNMSATYKNRGDAVSITPPAGYESFMDITGSYQ